MQGRDVGRLGQMAVETARGGPFAVDGLPPTGQRYQARGVVAPVGAQLSCHLEPIDIRHAQVQ